MSDIKIDGGLVPEQCNVCGQDGKLYECGSCQSSVYCSKECQLMDYDSGHRYECKKFIGANGDTPDERRAARRATIRRRRILRGRPGRPESRRRRAQQRRFEFENPSTGRSTRVLATVNLRPGDYEVYHVSTRMIRRRVRLRRSQKIVTRNVIIVETFIQTRNMPSQDGRSWVVFKPSLPPTTSDGEGPACVEIECPPQFPQNTTCWRCIEAIAAPSTGEEGEGDQTDVRRRRVVIRPRRRLDEEQEDEVEDIPEDIPEDSERPSRVPPSRRMPRGDGNDTSPRQPGIVVTIPGINIQESVSNSNEEDLAVKYMSEEEDMDTDYLRLAIEEVIN